MMGWVSASEYMNSLTEQEHQREYDRQQARLQAIDEAVDSKVLRARHRPEVNETTKVGKPWFVVKCFCGPVGSGYSRRSTAAAVAENHESRMLEMEWRG